MNDVRRTIDAARRFLLINPPVDDFSAYSLWGVPIGLLRVAAGLRAAGKEIAFFDLLDDPAMRLPPTSIAPEYRADGRHGFWKTPIPKPPELSMVPRRYSRFGATDDWIREKIHETYRSNKSNKTYIDPIAPDAILLATGMTYWYRSVIHTAGLLRERFPGVPVIVGGVAARLIPEHFAAAGLLVEEGELFPGIDLGNVSDIAARYDAYPLELMSGCPFRCRYCASSFFHEKVRVNDIEAQAEALKKWSAETSKREAVFFDDALLLDKGRYLKELLAYLDPGRFRFHVPNGIHLRELDAELATLLRLYQFSPLRFGFETISDRFDAKKDTAMLAEKLALLRDAGYHSADIGIYLLCGMPGQTVAEVEDSIAAVIAAGGRPYLSEFSPVPGTPLFEEHRVESRLDFVGEPLYQNNSLSAYRSPIFTPTVMKRLKDRLAALYREQDGR